MYDDRKGLDVICNEPPPPYPLARDHRKPPGGPRSRPVARLARFDPVNYRESAISTCLIFPSWHPLATTFGTNTVTRHHDERPHQPQHRNPKHAPMGTDAEGALLGPQRGEAPAAEHRFVPAPRPARLSARMCTASQLTSCDRPGQAEEAGRGTPQQGRMVRLRSRLHKMKTTREPVAF